MTLLDRVRAVLPEKYRQFAKFLIVGGTTWIIDSGIFLLLSHTVLMSKPLTAKLIAVLVAMIINYVLNREWSFSQRGGRERHHEAMLFFLFNGIGLGLNLLPLGLSLYVFGLNTPEYTQQFVSISNFVAGNIIGTIIAMAFRYWAYKKWVFLDLSTAEQDGVVQDVGPKANPTGL